MTGKQTTGRNIQIISSARQAEAIYEKNSLEIHGVSIRERLQHDRSSGRNIEVGSIEACNVYITL